MTSFAFSCVVDTDPILTAQAFIWVNCLKRIQLISPADIFVHVAGSSGTEYLDWLKSEKINIVHIDKFDARSPHCNKITQLETFRRATYDQIVLMDCDTAWVGQTPLPLGSPISACIVNEANPAERVLLNVFNASGLGMPDWCRAEFGHGKGREFTDVNNCNGGLYICNREFLARLAPLWTFWAHWCLQNRDLFEGYALHIDQVSFALAMRELGAAVNHLPINWNYPTHLPVGRLPDVKPEIIHYHRELDSHLKLKTLGLPTVDRAINKLNINIAEFISENLLNEVFWNFRYSIDPGLGSGIGSRGDALEIKRQLLSKALAPLDERQIVDVGCGDLEATRNLPARNYLGLDVSQSAVQIAKQKRPDWRFEVLRPADVLPKGEIILCLDVLIHQTTEAAFFVLIGRLAAAAEDRLIVSGYEDPPTFTSELTRYYLPITEALRRTRAFGAIDIVGRYRDVVVVAATKSSPKPLDASGAGRHRAKLGKIVVGSGWWCDSEPHEWALGSAATRSVEFFDLWYRQIVRCLQPDRIVVTDSASPIKPDYRSHDRVAWIELDRNYGHANDVRMGRVRTKYSGFTRSVISGAMYALCCDADFYVYVEQDCLLYGDDFLTHALGDTAEEILLGAPTENGKALEGSIATPMLQQSLMIVRRTGLERFIQGLLGSPWTDGERPPEEIMRLRLAPFDLLRVPYGRSRPIDFDRQHFYVQHLDGEELARFRDKLGLTGSAATEIPPSVPVTASPISTKGIASAEVARNRSEDPKIPSELRGELREWELAGEKARFWWRDDDAISDTPELRRLLALAGEVRTVVGLAVIPEGCDDTLANLVAAAPCCVWQHGWRHHWEQEQGDRQYSHGEFGEGRDPESMMAEAHNGQLALDRIFGEMGWQRIFVPPFHALSLPFKTLLPSLGYSGLSSGHPLTAPISTVAEVNAEIDIMNWPERKFRGSDAITRMLIEQLVSRRQGRISAEAPIGLLTHHLALDQEAWDFITELLRFLQSHGTAELVPADRLFEQANRSPAGPSRWASLDRAQVSGTGEVTVVVTSCGRQDLLEITLDSFLKYNTFPIKEFVVIEDGDGAKNQPLVEKYRQHPFRWLATGRRVGQVAAIDIAYEAVRTEFIFHCEDDWQFFAPGFIEKSLAILAQNHSILQVWLRAMADTNGHPVLNYALAAGGVSYRLFRHHHDAGKWGVWHGLSWNPGLRRQRDYRLLGSFGSLDPETTRETWQVESDASAFYQQRGLYAALLTDNGGNGYVRHIGAARRVPRDYLRGPANRSVDSQCLRPSEQHTNEKRARASVTVERDHYARLLMARLAIQPQFGSVPENCGRERDPGIDEKPEFQIWTHRETTSDQLRIEEQLDNLVEASSSILHIGAGNSSLGRRFTSRVKMVLATTLHDEERIFSQGLGIENYIVVTANKFSSDMDHIDGQFDFIIDNNPSSFACCLFHFSRMMISYVQLLKRDGGLFLTALPGSSWVCPGNNPNWSLEWDDWTRLGEILRMPVGRVTDFVYSMECLPESGAGALVAPGNTTTTGDVIAFNGETGGAVPGPFASKLTRASIEYNLTEHCNLSCYMCDHASPLLPKKFASVEEFSRDLQALAQVFHSEELRIVGGEPLLHPQLIGFLTEARRIGIADNIVLFTNGVLLDEAPDELWELIDWLKISAYPGVKRRIDDETCANICKAYNVDLTIKHIAEFEVIAINNCITDKALVQEIYRDCKSRGEWSCHTVHEGHFYKCPVAPFTSARLALRGITFDNPTDGIALHDNPNLREELDRYLNDQKPLAACSYCLGSSGCSVAHRQLNRRGRQQWLEQDDSAAIEAARENLRQAARQPG